ncbi:unnamed protein product, partial [Heterotrigona itama]
ASQSKGFLDECCCGRFFLFKNSTLLRSIEPDSFRYSYKGIASIHIGILLV